MSLTLRAGLLAGLALASPVAASAEPVSLDEAVRRARKVERKRLEREGFLSPILAAAPPPPPPPMPRPAWPCLLLPS